jgi:hypothetical protein
MESRSPARASDETDLRVAILLDSLVPSAADSQLLGDLLSAAHVNVAAVSVRKEVNLKARSRPKMALIMRMYRAVDRFANRRESNAEAGRFEFYASTLPAGTIIHFEDDRSLASELRAQDLDVILCLHPFEGAERYADCARYGLWWMGPSSSLRPEASYARHFFSTASARVPLAEMIWAATTEQPAPFPVEFGSTPLVSGVSVEKNLEPLETIRRSLWLAALRKPHLRGWDTIRASGANILAAAASTSAAAVQPNPEGSWPVASSFARMVLRQVRHRIQRRNQTELWRVGIRPIRDQGRAFCDTNGYQWLTARRGHWYADPFVLRCQDKDVLFMEEYDEARRQGCIVCAYIDSSCQVAGVQPVLQNRYHLAYPHVFEHGGEVFMIPDSGFNNTVELYHAVSFPWKWELVRILYSGPAFDTSVFPHEDGFWFFTSHVPDAGRHAAQLLLFHSSSVDGDWSMHPESPISHDARFARGAGRIFRRSSQILRPAQDGSQTYGGAVHFRRIEILNEREYAESADADITPAGISNAVGLHTYNRSATMEVIDCRIKGNPGASGLHGVKAGIPGA